MNPIRCVMVHVDGAPRGAARIALARDIARQHDAQLTALFATPPPILAIPYLGATNSAAIEALRKEHEELRARAIGTFEQAASERPERSAWIDVDGSTVVGAVARQALFADLLVLGQHQPGDPHAAALPPSFVESVLLASGRPALVVPYAGDFARVGDSVLIAWKETAESARALHASLPLLQGARHVHVATWGEPSVPRPVQGLNVESYLQLHGIQASVHRHAKEPSSVGESLLSMAADLSADMLVTGCYGHSRAREFVLGGVSRTLLQSMTVPVLMSH